MYFISFPCAIFKHLHPQLYSDMYIVFWMQYKSQIVWNPILASKNI
jgi:hypothetical protein